MSAPNASTFDLTPPYRPGTDTFNGIAKIDDAQFLPDPQTQPNAAEWNTMQWLIVALCRVSPVAVFTIAGASATIIGYVGAPKGPTVSTFAIAHPSAGVFEITWPVNTFPTSPTEANAGLNSGPAMIWTEPMTNGIRIHTYSPSASAADFDFTVSVF